MVMAFSSLGPDMTMKVLVSTAGPELTTIESASQTSRFSSVVSVTKHKSQNVFITFIDIVASV